MPPRGCCRARERPCTPRTSPTSRAVERRPRTRRDARQSRAAAVREPRRPSSHPAREPLGDLLQQPDVAVGIAERGIRGIGTALGIRTRGATPWAGVEAAAEATAGVVEHAHLDAARAELVA